jgi:hypothetical protein
MRALRSHPLLDIVRRHPIHPKRRAVLHVLTNGLLAYLLQISLDQGADRHGSIVVGSCMLRLGIYGQL